MKEIFYSMEEIDKTFFPKEYKKKKEEELIKKIGIGKWWALQDMAWVRRKIKELFGGDKK